MDEEQLSLKWNNHKTKFFENLKIQREKSNYTDATLAVEGKFYPVHKLVMSTCSEYFSDIFERTPCKSPVIVLKDVQSRDIEALLDYMYLGEVNVNQNHLASLIKTAECLKIKGLAVPDEDSTNIIKNTPSSRDNVSRDRPESPPNKRRRHDSIIIPPRAASPVPSSPKSTSSLVNSTQTFPIPPHSSSNTEQEESIVVKDEMDEVEESNTEVQEPPVVKIETDDDDDEPEELFRRKNYHEELARIDQDPLGNFGSDVSKTEHELENYGNTSFPGSSSVQQSSEDYWDEGDSNSFSTESYSGNVRTSQQVQGVEGHWDEGISNSFPTESYSGDVPISQQAQGGVDWNHQYPRVHPCLSRTIDAEQFILEVKSRPALWDLDLRDYKNKELKRRKWEELVVIFFKKEASIEEMREFIGALQRRWKHLRDEYVRNFKRRKYGSSSSPQTKYIFSNQLSFLQRVIRSNRM